MRLIIAKDYADVSRKAANIIAAQIYLKPDCVLGLATGSSPVGTYKELIAKYEAGDLDFSQVRTVNLDEYVGLNKDHDQSYAYFMRHNLFDHVNIAQKRYFPVPTPDIVLQLPVGDISILDFHKADKLVKIGYEYTITEWQVSV